MEYSTFLSIVYPKNQKPAPIIAIFEKIAIIYPMLEQLRVPLQKLKLN